MNFQDLQTVDTAQTYLDIAITSAKKRAEAVRTGGKASKTREDKLNKSINIELAKLTEIEKSLTKSLERIITRFPNLEGLTEFYQELVRSTLDYGYVKKSLGAVSWAVQNVRDFARKGRASIKRSRTIKDVNQHRKSTLGRISSILKQIDKHFEYLEHARKTMKDYPSIKEGVFTVCIAGFPNVGKSTLLKNITPANPEIRDYAFTTKKLNVGYHEDKYAKIQFVDTPGTLGRPKENSIEQQASLVLKYVADLIVYVYDPTDTYPKEDQEKLHKHLKKLRKPLLTYLSKTDIVPAAVTKTYHVDYTDSKKLMSALEKEHASFLR